MVRWDDGLCLSSKTACATALQLSHGRLLRRFVAFLFGLLFAGCGRVYPHEAVSWSINGYDLEFLDVYAKRLSDGTTRIAANNGLGQSTVFLLGGETAGTYECGTNAWLQWWWDQTTVDVSDADDLCTVEIDSYGDFDELITGTFTWTINEPGVTDQLTDGLISVVRDTDEQVGNDPRNESFTATIDGTPFNFDGISVATRNTRGFTDIRGSGFGSGRFSFIDLQIRARIDGGTSDPCSGTGSFIVMDAFDTNGAFTGRYIGDDICAITIDSYGNLGEPITGNFDAVLAEKTSGVELTVSGGQFSVLRDTDTHWD